VSHRHDFLVICGTNAKVNVLLITSLSSSPDSTDIELFRHTTPPRPSLVSSPSEALVPLIVYQSGLLFAPMLA